MAVLYPQWLKTMLGVSFSSASTAGGVFHQEMNAHFLKRTIRYRNPWKSTIARKIRKNGPSWIQWLKKGLQKPFQKLARYPKDHWTLKTGYLEAIQVQTLRLEGPRSLGQKKIKRLFWAHMSHATALRQEWPTDDLIGAKKFSQS